MSEIVCTELHTIAPRVFFRLAAHYHQTPETLAFMLLHDFCKHPPAAVTIVEHATGNSVSLSPDEFSPQSQPSSPR